MSEPIRGSYDDALYKSTFETVCVKCAIQIDVYFTSYTACVLLGSICIAVTQDYRLLAFSVAVSKQWRFSVTVFCYVFLYSYRFLYCRTPSTVVAYNNHRFTFPCVSQTLIMLCRLLISFFQYRIRLPVYRLFSYLPVNPSYFLVSQTAKTTHRPRGAAPLGIRSGMNAA